MKRAEMCDTEKIRGAMVSTTKSTSNIMELQQNFYGDKKVSKQQFDRNKTISGTIQIQQNKNNETTSFDGTDQDGDVGIMKKNKRK